MGIEYTASVGYGIAARFERDDDLPGPQSVEQWYDGDVDVWFDLNGYDLLTAEIGGNNWTDERNWRVLIRATVESYDKYSDGGGGFVSLPEPSEKALRQLSELRLAWDRTEPSGWKFFWDVT